MNSRPEWCGALNPHPFDGLSAIEASQHYARVHLGGAPAVQRMVRSIQPVVASFVFPVA